jgi:hypothetical protein
VLQVETLSILAGELRVEQKCGPLYYYCTPWWSFQKVETKGGRWKSSKDEGRKIAGRKILKGEGHVVNYLEEFQQIYKEILNREQSHKYDAIQKLLVMYNMCRENILK